MKVPNIRYRRGEYYFRREVFSNRGARFYQNFEDFNFNKNVIVQK